MNIREIRPDNFRFHSRNVPTDTELVAQDHPQISKLKAEGDMG